MPQLYDVAGGLQGGYSNWGQTAGENIRQGNLLAEQRQKQNMLAAALPNALAGDSNALAQIYQADPNAGLKVNALLQDQAATQYTRTQDEAKTKREQSRQLLEDNAKGLALLGEDKWDAAYPTTRARLVAADPETFGALPEVADESVKAYLRGMGGVKPAEPEKAAARPFWLKPDGTIDQTAFGGAERLATAGAQLRVDNMPPVNMNPNDRLVDPRTGRLIAEAPPAPPKPLPASIANAENDDISAIQSATAMNADLGALREQIATGKLKVGPVANVISEARNAVGRSTEQSRNFASFKSALERQRNESLRLNKGVQTEGDAVRAWNEVMANINDPDLVAERLLEIEGINARAVDFRDQAIQNRRATYQRDPLDTTQFRQAPAAIGATDPGRPGGYPQPRGPQPGTVEDGYRFKGGDASNPANWEKV